MTRTAHREAKTVKVFETLEDQARMFAGLPEPAEVRYLTDAIHDRTPHLARRGELKSLEEAWMNGDLARVGASLVDAMRTENPALYEALLKRRNLAWAQTLSAEMRTPGVSLVNVGALHMVGDDGLPALMRARGFSVRRVQ
jgi:uncharacterized protein YbaP (TraB family)